MGNDDFKEEFTLDIATTGYSVNHKSGSIISIRFSRGREMLLKDFFKENLQQYGSLTDHLLKAIFLSNSKRLAQSHFLRLVLSRGTGLELISKKNPKEQAEQQIAFNTS